MNHQLQQEVGDWHRRVYPDAATSAIAMKLAEETGEVCRAVDRMIYQGGWADQLAEEAGDVVIALTALCERLGVDLDAAVTSRWSEVRQRPSTRQIGTDTDPPDHMHADYNPPISVLRTHVTNAHRDLDVGSPWLVDNHWHAHQQGGRR